MAVHLRKVEESGLNTGAWNPKSEEWFRKRRADVLDSGTNVPITAPNWWTVIKGQTESKKGDESQPRIPIWPHHLGMFIMVHEHTLEVSLSMEITMTWIILISQFYGMCGLSIGLWIYHHYGCSIQRKFAGVSTNACNGFSSQVKKIKVMYIRVYQSSIFNKHI